MTILQAFAEFNKYYLVGNDYSQKTSDGYWWVIRSLTIALGDIEMSQLDYEAYTAWRGYMNDKHNKSSTIHTNVSLFKVFIKFFYGRGECPLSPDEVRTPKRPRNNPKYAPKDRVEALIKHCTNIRDQAIIAVMFSTGLRNAELRTLKRTDIMGTDVHIHNGKGGKDGLVYLDDRAKDLMERYLNSRTDDSPYAFVTNWGDKIASSTLRYIFKNVSERAGVEHTSPHQLRHGAATEMMKQGVHMRYIQEYMRHDYITTTQIYTHVEKPDLKREHSRVFGAKMNGKA